MITIEDVRKYGNLPKRIEDEFLEVHLSVGKREAKKKVKDYDVIMGDTAHSFYEDAKEITVCEALISLLPKANTFFVEGIPSINENGVQARFFSPKDIAAMIEGYEKRISKLLVDISKENGSEGASVSEKGFRFCIIGGKR